MIKKSAKLRECERLLAEVERQIANGGGDHLAYVFAWLDGERRKYQSEQNDREESERQALDEYSRLRTVPGLDNDLYNKIKGIFQIMWGGGRRSVPLALEVVAECVLGLLSEEGSANSVLGLRCSDPIERRGLEIEFSGISASRDELKKAVHQLYIDVYVRFGNKYTGIHAVSPTIDAPIPTTQPYVACLVDRVDAG